MSEFRRCGSKIRQPTHALTFRADSLLIETQRTEPVIFVKLLSVVVDQRKSTAATDSCLRERTSEPLKTWQGKNANSGLISDKLAGWFENIPMNPAFIGQNSGNSQIDPSPRLCLNMTINRVLNAMAPAHSSIRMVLSPPSPPYNPLA